MSQKTFDSVLQPVMIPVVAKYFKFSPKLFLRKNCKSIYSVYGILHKKFSDEEMKLLLDKACEMKDKEFFKSVVKENDVKVNVFTDTKNPLLIKIGKNIELLKWVVDNVVGFTGLDRTYKAKLFLSLIMKDKINVEIIRNIITTLNISIEGIEIDRYAIHVSRLNVQRAIELTNLFTHHTPKVFEELIFFAVHEKNYDLMIWILSNRVLNYDIFKKSQAIIFTKLNFENTDKTLYIIDMLLRNIGKTKDEIISDCKKLEGVNPFAKDIFDTD